MIDAGRPTRPYGQIRPLGEYARDPEPPPYNRPDVEINPPIMPSYPSPDWRPGESWATETLPWMVGGRR